MRVSWMGRENNVRVLGNIKQEWTLESLMTQAVQRYFGRVLRQERGMENNNNNNNNIGRNGSCLTWLATS